MLILHIPVKLIPFSLQLSSFVMPLLDFRSNSVVELCFWVFALYINNSIIYNVIENDNILNIPISAGIH